MDKKLLEILACPLCKGELVHDRKANELICRLDRLAFPVMLVSEARELPPTEEINA